MQEKSSVTAPQNKAVPHTSEGGHAAARPGFSFTSLDWSRAELGGARSALWFSNIHGNPRRFTGVHQALGCGSAETRLASCHLCLLLSKLWGCPASPLDEGEEYGKFLGGGIWQITRGQ